MNTSDWTTDRLDELNEELRYASPREVLAWTFLQFAPEVVLATSFGTSDILLSHIVSTLRPETSIFYLDTGLFFPETYALRDRLEAQLGIRFQQVEPDLTLAEQETQHGAALWARNPNQCCHIRKVQPLERVLRGKSAWITGIRRDQAPTRAHSQIVEWDAAFGLVKVNPLAFWTEEEVRGYLSLNDLPYNELHDRGYPSIGCAPCTHPVAAGADPRSGRWTGSGKIECGIHLAHTESEH